MFVSITLGEGSGGGEGNGRDVTVFVACIRVVLLSVGSAKEIHACYLLVYAFVLKEAMHNCILEIVSESRETYKIVKVMTVV